MEKKHIEHLYKVNEHWNGVYSNLLILNKVDSRRLNEEFTPYITKLALLPVSKKSTFRDMLWDYESETINRSASISRKKVQLDFSIYKNIPLGITTEIKCIFLAVYSSPKEFGHSKNEIKPNTLIAIFKDGLNFLDYVIFKLGRRLGSKYVQANFHSLCDLALTDFESAVKSTKLKLVTQKSRNPTYKIFF